jgi:hypothetical protein
MITVPNRLPRTSATILLLAMLAPLLTGCGGSGYRFASAYDQSIQTVAVPIFENPTYEHGVEFHLTEAIIKEIHRTTPWRVVDRERAQAELSGAITSADLHALVQDSDTGLIEQYAYTLGVAFEFKRRSDGEVLLARRNFRTAQTFVPDRLAGERLEFGQRSATDQLARDIVAELRSNW